LGVPKDGSVVKNELCTGESLERGSGKLLA